MLATTLSFLVLGQVSGGGAISYDSKVPVGTWTVESIRPVSHQGELVATLSTASGMADLYVRKGSAPTLSQYDFKLEGSQTSKVIRVHNRSTPALTNDLWYIGVYNKKNRPFTLSKTLNVIPSQFEGKGAIPFTGGTSFRVWAPNAQSVHASGQFNNWNGTVAPMQPEPNGWWSLDIRGAGSGQQYKFVIRNGAQTLWKNDPYARRMTSSVGNSVIYDHNAHAWQNGSFQTPTWNDMVMYEMHVGTFNDTPGGAPGTFTTAIARLDYLQSLGVNAIQLMPIQEFPGDYSWGYNPSHQFSVEAAYGGAAAFKSFVDAANQRGIAVLMDLVHNHWGPNDMDLWRFDGWSQGTYGGIYFYQDNRSNTPWGNTRPDYGRGEVRQFIRDNQMEWAEKFRVSGFRWDATAFMRRTDAGDNPDGWSLMQWLNNELDATQPWKINIAEDLQNESWMTRDTFLGGAGFDSQWSNYVHTIREALTTSDDNSRNMFAVRDMLNERYNGDAFEQVIYTESHDENANGKQRVTSTIDPSDPDSYWAQKRSTLGAALTMTAPGIPMLFQGQEILEDGWFSDSDPVDWNKLNTYSGINQLYKDLIKLRRNLTGRTNGLRGGNINTHHVNNANKVIAYHRWMNGGSNDDVVVVANFRNQTWNNYRIGLPRSGGWSVVFNSDWNGYSPLFGNVYSPDITADSQAWDGMAYSGVVNLAPYSVVILAKQ